MILRLGCSRLRCSSAPRSHARRCPRGTAPAPQPTQKAAARPATGSFTLRIVAAVPGPAAHGTE